MDEKQKFDFWYAVNNTEIISLPQQHLETFGSTVLNYHMISQLMDSTTQVRVREGRIKASKPQIITPEAYSKTFLDGFGEEAQKYIEWLKEHDVHILQYGYQLSQREFNEHIVTEEVKAVTQRVKSEVARKNDPLSAILIGVDTPWDVCLIKLFYEVIQASAQTNITQLQKKHMFDDDHGLPRGVRGDIEAMFLAASKNPALIKGLAKRLQSYGVFTDYEDRFFALVRASKES